MSLRVRLALVIALLAFLPNLVLALTLGALGEGPWPPLLLWLLLLALLSGLAGYFLAKSLLRPLEELTRALAYLSLKEGPLEALRLPTPKEPLRRRSPSSAPGSPSSSPGSRSSWRPGRPCTPPWPTTSRPPSFPPCASWTTWRGRTIWGRSGASPSSAP